MVMTIRLAKIQIIVLCSFIRLWLSTLKKKQKKNKKAEVVPL